MWYFFPFILLLHQGYICQGERELLPKYLVSHVCEGWHFTYIWKILIWLVCTCLHGI